MKCRSGEVYAFGLFLGVGGVGEWTEILPLFCVFGQSGEAVDVVRGQREGVVLLVHDRTVQPADQARGLAG